jgi:hypothetical protein
MWHVPMWNVLDLSAKRFVEKAGRAQVKKP